MAEFDGVQLVELCLGESALLDFSKKGGMGFGSEGVLLCKKRCNLLVGKGAVCFREV
jgi:hypothetical protein